MNDDAFDLVVLGAGSAGYAAARVAATVHGARVALVDRGPLGGLCILAGCMPSKALIQAGKVAHAVKHAADFGITATPGPSDFATVMARKDRLIAGFAADRLAGLAALPNTELITGTARFVAPDAIAVGDRRIKAAHVVIATGSRPVSPPIPGLDAAGAIDSAQALNLKTLPASMLVIGGGVIALELGQFYARLGTRVTIVEAAPRLMAREDEDVSAVMLARLRREGLTIYVGATIARAERVADRPHLHLTTADGETLDLDAELLLVATGRAPDYDALGLETAQIQVANRKLVLDRCLRTTNPRVLAAGDATGASHLVHVAVAEGELAAHNAFAGCQPRPLTMSLYVAAAFTEPNVARVGLSETEAKAQNRQVLVGRYAFKDHGKANLLGEEDGFVKLLADPLTGALLGATCVGPEGAELIHELACAITLGATVERFLQVPHVHPTLAEIWTYPAEDLLDQLRTLPVDSSMSRPAGYGDDCPAPSQEGG